MRPVQLLVVGDSVYELYQARDGKIMLQRGVLPESPGMDSQVFGRVNFESAEQLDEKLRQLVPDNMNWE